MTTIIKLKDGKVLFNNGSVKWICSEVSKTDPALTRVTELSLLQAAKIVLNDSKEKKEQIKLQNLRNGVV